MMKHLSIVILFGLAFACIFGTVQIQITDVVPNGYKPVQTLLMIIAIVCIVVALIYWSDI